MGIWGIEQNGCCKVGFESLSELASFVWDLCLTSSSSVWQPLVGAIYDQPLAICDGSTIAYSDLVAADHITQRHFAVNCFATYSPNYNWWYLNEQRREEVVLFKNFDSDYRVNAKCWCCKYPHYTRVLNGQLGCLHTSFVHPRHKAESKPPRESIEVRALVFS